MSHHDQEFARTPASLLIAPATHHERLRSEPLPIEGETRVIVKGQGVLSAAFRDKKPQPFMFLIQDGTRNGFRLRVEEGTAVFEEQQRDDEWEVCTKASIQPGSGLDADAACVYWFSVDSHNGLLRYGKGEVRKNTLLAELRFPLRPANYDARANQPPYEYAWVSGISVIHTESPHAVTPIEIYRDPVIADPAMYVVASEKISMEQVARNTATVAANLTPACQQLYATVSGANFSLDTDDFPDFTKAIEASIASPKGWCYRKLAEKSGEFGGQPNPAETYLRITMGLNQGDSPGIPYVMEIWPPGHYSPVHNHGAANAMIRVLHGEITVNLYPMLSDHHLVPFMVAKFGKGDVTWISPELNQVHQLRNANVTGPSCITIQCYMYGDGNVQHYNYFDYIGENGQIAQFTPNTDMDFLGFKEKMRQEWIMRFNANA